MQTKRAGGAARTSIFRSCFINFDSEAESLGTNQMSSAWVVTGAAGFLGSHVVEQLLKRQIPVIGIDNLSGGKWQHLAPFASNPLFQFHCVDIRDEAALLEIFRRERPGVVVHLAALHFIPAAMRNPG